jgi:TonB family protein
MASGSDLTRRIERVLSGRKSYDIPVAWRRVLAASLVLPAAALAVATAGVAPAPTSQAPGGETQPDTSSPRARIVSWGEGLEQWYPEAAKQKGIDGRVRVAVTLDESSQLTDTLIVSESPEGLGFAAAAMQAVQTFVYANPTGHPTTLIFDVKFELAGGRHPRTNTLESPPAPEPPAR